MQFDILFLGDGPVGHLICLCTRWTCAGFLTSRVTEVVLNFITHYWIRLFGPPRYLISDQEGALASDEGAAWADRWNIELKPRPRGNHAHVVERHQEILRQQYHRVKSQCAQEGLRVTKEAMMDETNLAKNVLVSVHGESPYAAMFGRVPNLLQDLEPLNRAALDDQDGGDASRHVM